MADDAQQTDTVPEQDTASLGTKLAEVTVPADAFAPAADADPRHGKPSSIPRGVWQIFDPPEVVRVYEYATGPVLTYHNVSRFKVDDDGNHFLETTDGRRAIVAPGWRVIHLEIDGWAD